MELNVISVDETLDEALYAFEGVAELFKVLAHPTRLAILALLRDGEECVCHITAMLGARQAYVSQQLMALRQAGLVTDRRDGWNIYYRVTRPDVYGLLDAARVAAIDEPRVGETVWKKAASCPCPKCQAGMR